MNKSFKLLIFLILFSLIGIYFIFPKQKTLPVKQPTTSINEQGKTKVKYPQDFTIVMVGDSMTETLGNSDELKKFLSDYNKGKSFEVLNYGFGATNILSVMDRITKETQHNRKFRPIEEIDYDVILIESFGQNPLSQYPLDQGLKIQWQELDKIVSRLRETNPHAQILFVATISPNKEIFAKNQVDLSAETRTQWVSERIAYIKNHIAYAKQNNIPVINVFEASFLENGDGNPDFISTTDYIHPSPKGIIFISKEIADFISKNNILKI